MIFYECEDSLLCDERKIGTAISCPFACIVYDMWLDYMNWIKKRLVTLYTWAHQICEIVFNVWMKSINAGGAFCQWDFHYYQHYICDTCENYIALVDIGQTKLTSV